MDIRLRFKKDEKKYNDRTCIIVININDFSIGIVVDIVSEVLQINSEDILEPPNINEFKNKFIKKIVRNNKDVVLVVDCEKLLSKEDFEEINYIV